MARKLQDRAHKFVQTRLAIYCAVFVLVVSLGLLCVEQQQRYSGGSAPGVGLGLPRCELGISSSDGAVVLRVQWEYKPNRRGLYFGLPAHRLEFGHGLHFNALGFGFGFLPKRFHGEDYSIPPHVGFSMPLWFTASASLVVVLLGRHLCRRSEKPPFGNAPRKRFAYQGAENWLLTCSLMFAVAELLWYCARFFRKYDLLEIPMSIPLFPPGMLLDFSSGMIRQRGLLVYAFAFWIGLFLFSLILSRKQINPAIPAGIILGLLTLGGFVLVFVAK